MKQASNPFWRGRKLEEFSAEEWESLCDGCGQCCLLKLEEEDTGELFHTKLACSMLDIGTCRCRDYANRQDVVPDCTQITSQSIPALRWLPSTCAYRLVSEGKDLRWWHPLVSGDSATVHEAGVSVRDWARSETGVPESRITRFIIRDPSQVSPAIPKK